MGSNKLGDSGMIALTAKIMVVIIIFLFLIVVFMFFLHLYTKWFSSYRQEDPNGATRRRRRRQRMDFAGGYQEVNVLRNGLDPSILKTIPVIQFNTSKEFKDGLECSVCLSEVSEGEKARLLPKCNHGFHVDCIDMWFQSHSTCPLCRNPVSEKSSPNSSTSAESTPETTSVAAEQSSASTELTNIPSNVLFWGDETQVRTLGPCLEIPTSSSSSSSTSNRLDGILVIDIPRQTTEEEEEHKTPTPTPTRLRSWTRLFSRVNSSSSRNVDVEQGSTGQS